MPLEDAALLERWTRRRDAEAFNEIVERFASQVYVTCRRVLNNDADAEEVAQECFFTLARSSCEVHSSLGGWLHQVATYKSRDRIRGDARRRNRERIYGGQLQDSVEPRWDDIRDQVDEAVETLPDEVRDAVVAHFLGRKTHAEIAAELRLSRRAVSYRIARALEALRDELRRRGVAVSVTALGAALIADASAAPISLKASLGKLAIAAGTTSSASEATAIGNLLGSLILMKAKSLLAAGILIALAAGLYFALTRAPLDVIGRETANPSRNVEIARIGKRATAPLLNTVAAATAETPSLTALLALSRGELERALENYPFLEKSASLSGIVLDERANPVPDATVALVPSHNWGTLPGAGDIARTAMSGTDGVYHLDDIKRGGDFRVAVSKQGFASVAQYTLIESGKDVTVDFTMKSGSSIQGRVVSASGEPVPDAYVYCIGLTGPRRLVSDLQRATRTDREGEFILGFKEEERGFLAAVRAQSAKHGAATFPDIVVQDDHPIELRLAAPGVIRGAAKDRSGKPLSGARIQFFAQKTIDIKRDDGEAWSSPAYAGSFIAITDSSGLYATEVDAGMVFQAQVEVHGSDDGRERLDNIPALAAGETREYNPVFDTDSITVRATFVGQQSAQPFSAYIPIDAVAFDAGNVIAQGQQDGPTAIRLTLPGKPGSYTFQARYMYDHDVAGDISQPYELKPGDAIDIQLDLPDPQSFAVRTVDISGQPVVGASIKFYTETWGGEPLKYGQTNADGRLDEPILLAPLSGARMLVERPGYALAQGPAYTDQGPGTVHPEETIVLWSGAGFEGNLLDAEKRPLADTPLIVTVTNNDGQQWPLQATTDGNGHFTVVNQAPADVVNIAITTRDGTAAWTVQQLQLKTDTITSFGEVAAAGQR